MKKINKIIEIIFLFSFVFFPFLTSADEILWYYTGGIEKHGPFKTEAECGASLLKYKSGPLVGNTTVCKSETSYTVGKSPTVNTPVSVDLEKEKEEKNGEYNLLAPIGGLTEAPADVGDYFNKIFLLAIGLCGALAVVMLIIGGIQYMGSESVFGKTDGKKQMFGALGGLGIALAAYALLNTINPDLLGKSGFTVKKIEVIQEAPILSDAGKTIPAKNSFENCQGGVRNVQVVGKGTETQNFIFCSAYASNLQKMFSAAALDKIFLSGGSFRPYSEQVALRNKNCPEPKLTVPPGSCTPPTAIPGTSNHEQGLAVDLNCDGILINFDGKQKKYPQSLATKKCFDWLKANAGKYGFSNLTSENWHWSTGPKRGY